MTNEHKNYVQRPVTTEQSLVYHQLLYHNKCAEKAVVRALSHLSAETTIFCVIDFVGNILYAKTWLSKDKLLQILNKY